MREVAIWSRPETTDLCGRTEGTYCADLRPTGWCGRAFRTRPSPPVDVHLLCEQGRSQCITRTRPRVRRCTSSRSRHARSSFQFTEEALRGRGTSYSPARLGLDTFAWFSHSRSLPEATPRLVVSSPRRRRSRIVHVSFVAERDGPRGTLVWRETWGSRFDHVSTCRRRARHGRAGRGSSTRSVSVPEVSASR